MWGLSELTETSRWRWGRWTTCLRSLPKPRMTFDIVTPKLTRRLRRSCSLCDLIQLRVFPTKMHERIQPHKTNEHQISKPAPYYFSDTINQVKLQNQHRTTFQIINQLKHDDCSSPWITGKFIMTTTRLTTMGLNGAGRNCGLMPPPPDVLNRSSDRVFSPMSLTEFLLKL